VESDRVVVAATGTAHSVESSMQSWKSSKQSQAGPRRRGRHDRHDESLDEAPRVLDDEPADIEQAIPVEEDESVEEIQDAEESASRVFDEGAPGDDDEPHE
jgi:hypothetical protein